MVERTLVRGRNLFRYAMVLALLPIRNAPALSVQGPTLARKALIWVSLPFENSPALQVLFEGRVSVSHPFVSV